MKTGWIGAAMVVVALVALSAPADAQIKITCESGTKPCGPVCIPVAEQCSIRTMGPTRGKIGRGKTKTKHNTKHNTKVAAEPQAVSWVQGCSAHTGLAKLAVPEATQNVTSGGWNAAKAKTRVNDAYTMKMIDVTQGSNRGSVGLFDYINAGQANIFAQRMNEFTNAVAVRNGPSGTRVIAVLIEEGDRAAALELLQVAVGCTKGDPSKASSTAPTDDPPQTPPTDSNRPLKVPAKP